MCSLLRYIIIIDGEFRQTDLEREKLRKLLERYSDKLHHIIIRIDSVHLEVDVDIQHPDSIDEIVNILKDFGYNIKHIRRLEDEDDTQTLKEDQILDMFLNLFQEHRFWEAHEFLEGIWKNTGNDYYRALILLTIPYIKLQMGQYDRIEKAMKRFLEYQVDRHIHKLDINCIKNEIRKIMDRMDKPNLIPVIDIKKCMRKK